MPASIHVKQLDPQLWLLADQGSTCYVLCGTERALLIDTAYGSEDLRALVRTLTLLPLTVVNTHGHPDHIFGNVYADEAWLHPADQALAEGFLAVRAEAWHAAGLAPCPFRPLTIGQQFDLGGGTVAEVVPLFGHTAGSIGLLERGRRVLFSGDGIISHIWMQLKESLSIEALRETLLHVQRCYGADFDRLLHGHAADYTDKQLVNHLLQGCEELLRGETEGDRCYPYYEGSMQHFCGGSEGCSIVYADKGK